MNKSSVFAIAISVVIIAVVQAAPLSSNSNNAPPPNIDVLKVKAIREVNGILQGIIVLRQYTVRFP